MTRCANCLSSDVVMHTTKGGLIGYECNTCGVCLPYAIAPKENNNVERQTVIKEVA